MNIHPITRRPMSAALVIKTCCFYGDRIKFSIRDILCFILLFPDEVAQGTRGRVVALLHWSYEQKEVRCRRVCVPEECSILFYFSKNKKQKTKNQKQKDHGVQKRFRRPPRDAYY